MSILLEALKKSEKSRQLGETPTLQTPVEEADSRGRSSSSLVPLLLIMLSAIVMAWFGWQQFAAPEPVDLVSEPAMVDERAEPEARTMTEKFQGEPENQPVSDAGEKMQDEDRKQQLKQSFDQFAAEPEDEAEMPEPEAMLEETAAEPAARNSVANEDAGEEEDTDEAKDAGGAMEPHIAEPISYWELPQGVRDNMPEIRITVLVFAVEPENRFLLANGERYMEKDELDSGLVLDEIRRDGAVFKYRKYRFILKG